MTSHGLFIWSPVIGYRDHPADIDRASGTFGCLLYFFPGDKSPGYKIFRSYAACCLSNLQASLDMVYGRWQHPASDNGVASSSSTNMPSL